ncbi:GEVED domain-containing protein [Tenacibaculum sp. SG-28]|uniref:GEVED domain-containing protein n=1 Tax=Tenacibaculum sp. SG-28 TaxID=754426 RepID=UPI000D475659|nr:GEVED domain-containing protein [Tenacibaculum sp. SG-28]PQJ21811.1 hypothetical protein BSU00_07080 [Tenacibaculum sp. SG-28]
MHNLEYRQSKDPMLHQRMQEIEDFTLRKVKQMNTSQGKIVGNVIQIPVVVHVIYSNSQENISEAQIQSQIAVLNEDFRRTNADQTDKWSQAADSEIEFYLAEVDAEGNTTNGITRKASTTTEWGTTDAMKLASQGGVNPWNTEEYLNIWVCNIGGGILGYAQFPGGSAATDGVVISPQYFGSSDKGSNFYLMAPFDKGRTTTHEVGHFLNLRHIWGDGGCGIDDAVADTPISDGANYGCAAESSSCGSEDMVQNYMDYSDDSCMNLYTLGQKSRMRAVLAEGGFRRSLALSDKKRGGGACSAAVPNGLNTSSISSSRVVITWDSVAAATYDVRYREIGTSSWNSTAVSATSITLTELSENTQYEVQVRSKCTSEISAYSASVNFRTSETILSYCTSKGNSVTDEYIQTVQLGGINNQSGSGNGYTDHTDIFTNLAKGDTNTITITPFWTGNVYNEGYGVFIDYNQDGDFEDSGEIVFTKSPSQITPVIGSFTIPDSAKEGPTRMRVILSYEETPEACGTYEYGETEDYTVIIGAVASDIEAPTSPADLTANNITETTIDLSWTAASDNVGVIGYDILQGTILIGSVSDTSINITGLVANTEYDFTVFAKDAAGNVSNPETITITTKDIILEYCDSQGNDSSYEWIDFVSFGGMTNSSGNNAGYADFTDKVANVTRGSTAQLIISAGFRSSSYVEFWSVWIDFNKDGIFQILKNLQVVPPQVPLI